MNTLQKAETAFRMNLAGFDKLIKQCTSLGKAYKPDSPSLKLTALNTLRKQIEQVNREKGKRMQDLIKAMNERASLDMEIKNLIRDMIDAITPAIPEPSQQGEAETGEIALRAKSEAALSMEKPPLFDKILQLRDFPPHITTRQEPADGTLQPSRHSRQAWFSKQADNLIDLAEKLDAEETYAPGKEAITPEALRNMALKMQEYQQAISAAAEAQAQAATQREAAFYDPEAGLVSIANATKAYLLETFGKDSDTGRLVQVILFSDATAKNKVPA